MKLSKTVTQRKALLACSILDSWVTWVTVWVTEKTISVDGLYTIVTQVTQNFIHAYTRACARAHERYMFFWVTWVTGSIFAMLRIYIKLPTQLPSYPESLKVTRTGGYPALPREVT